MRVRARLKSGSMATKSLSDAASTPSSAVSITSIAVTTVVMANGRATPAANEPVTSGLRTIAKNSASSSCRDIGGGVDPGEDNHQRRQLK